MPDIDIEPATTPVEEPAPEEAPKPLGPEGEKALDIWKQRAKAAEKEAKRASELEARLAQIEEANKSEQEKALDAARKEAADQARGEAIAAAHERILNAEIKAAAKGVLADPADARKFLDLSEIEVSDDGDVDSDAITAALSRLVESKPYLAAQGDKRFGDADGGARKESGPSQLSRDDLKSMSPQEIEQARQQGRLSDLLGS